MELVKSLTGLGDHAHELSDTSTKLASDVNLLNNLVSKLSTDKFKLFDTDADGFISLNEFNEGLTKV